MKRFFWKEWRERGLWFVLWTLTVVVLAALGEGQQRGIYYTLHSPWNLLPPLLALLAGLLGYGSELKGGRAAFLYSRAQLWKSLLFVKIVSGIIVVLVSVTLGALAYRLTAPAVYLPLLTPAYLAKDAWAMALITGGAYLFGLSCSIVLPGVAGGIVTALLWVGMFLLVDNTLVQLQPHVNFTFNQAITFYTPLIALVVLARFGLTLSWWPRMIRFLLIMGTVLFCAAALVLLPATKSLIDRIAPSSIPETSIQLSPDGHNVLITHPQNNQPAELAHLATAQRIPFPPTTPVLNGYWITDDYLLFWPTSNSHCYLADLHGERLHFTELSRDKVNNYWPDVRSLYPSPDGMRILRCSLYDISLINPQTDVTRVIAKQPDRNSNSFETCWWQDNHTIGYIDPVTGQRTLVKAP